MTYTTRQLQEALNRHGYRVAIDGIMGPETENAISNFKGSHGLRRRPLIGPLTAKLLFGDDIPDRRDNDRDFPPWVNELGRYMGLHEVRDKGILSRWLKSDGGTLGDPSKLPWCGDAMHTAIRLTLPDEPFPGPLGENPYWARNWVYLGHEHELALGVMVVSKRGSGGHISTAVGYDPQRRRIRVRGGNQSNTINDTWIDEGRTLGLRGPKRAEGYRKPATYGKALPPIPIMNSAGQVISRNEA